MKFNEVLNKVTGVSCPIFGVSWNPAELDIEIARRIIIFLEPRRVLYAPMGIEALCSSIDSVGKIKDYLTLELQKIQSESNLSEYLRGMRKACNKFLSTFPEIKDDKCIYCKPGSNEYQEFILSLGEFRTVIGTMVGQVSKAYGIDVEDDLANIIPE
ncbi:MAG: DUF6650 family protein [Anaerorhabdus sp.]|uniref:DUF6650 family protein n=1 Tax=Anaerorhabdus sp. TaxID=1872524 RepID=UPI002FCC151F